MTKTLERHQIREKKALPDGWRWVKFGDVCNIVMGQSPSGDSYNSNGIGEPLLNGPTEFGPMHPKPVQWTTDPKRFAKKGDILFCVRGATTGRKNIADQDYCIGRGLAAIRGRSKATTTEFLKFLLDQITATLLKETAGSTFPNLPGDKLKKFQVALPPLDEQKRIVAILNEQMAAVEKARAAAETQLEAADALPAAYLRQVFDSPEAQTWEMKRLGDLTEIGISNGAFKKRYQFGQGTPIVNVSDLYRSLAVNLNDVELVETSDQDLERYGIRSGDLFFCRSSLKREGIGWCCYVDEVKEPAIFECHVMRVRLNHQIMSPIFVAYYCMHPSVRYNFINRSRTATMTTMNQQDLAATKIPTPPLETQRRLVKILEAKNLIIKAVQQSLQDHLDAINAMPASLLRRAFSGEL